MRGTSSETKKRARGHGVARKDDPIALSGWPPTTKYHRLFVQPLPTYADSGMQPSADNRTGYVVDLAGNIYELLRQAPSCRPSRPLRLYDSAARFRFRSLASSPFCLSAALGRPARERGEVTRVAGNQHFRSWRPSRNSFSLCCACSAWGYQERGTLTGAVARVIY